MYRHLMTSYDILHHLTTSYDLSHTNSTHPLHLLHLLHPLLSPFSWLHSWFNVSSVSFNESLSVLGLLKPRPGSQFISQHSTSMGSSGLSVQLGALCALWLLRISSPNSQNFTQCSNMFKIFQNVFRAMFYQSVLSKRRKIFKVMAAPITLWPWVLGAWATSAYVRMFEQGRGMPGMLQLCFNKNVPSLLWNVEHNWACQDLSKPRKRNMHNAKIRPICFGKKKVIWRIDGPSTDIDGIDSYEATAWSGKAKAIDLDMATIRGAKSHIQMTSGNRSVYEYTIVHM